MNINEISLNWAFPGGSTYISQQSDSSSNEIEWGPERKTFTMEKRPDYPVFNSIKDNPTIGDERCFVRIGEITREKTVLQRSLKIRKGHQYLVYVYVHNNCSEIYNYSEYNYRGIATAVKLSVSFAEKLKKGENGKIEAAISSEATKPQKIWAGVNVKADENIKLRCVAGSAKYSNDWETNGEVLPSSLFTKEGAYLSLKNGAIGAIPGGREYLNAVSFVLEAEDAGRKSIMEKLPFKIEVEAADVIGEVLDHLFD